VPKYPISGSSLDRKITSGLSTLITVKVGNTSVGALQTLDIKQNRPTVKWQEIGTDGFVENHPKGAANVTASATRIVFDGLSITESFARGFFNIQAQRIPFDIQIIDRQQGDGSLAVLHTLHSCWFTDIATPYKSSDFLVIQTASFDCLKITTTRMGESAAIGGINGIGYEFDSIERSTDVKGYQGRLDPAGSTFSNNSGVTTDIKDALASAGKLFGAGTPR
jgi:hypothetical protein